VVPLIGYVDRFSARPGETVAVKVSSELGDPYRADLVRIIHDDANPGGPGVKFEEVPSSFAGIYRSRDRVARIGHASAVTPTSLGFMRSGHSSGVRIPASGSRRQQRSKGIADYAFVSTNYGLDLGPKIVATGFLPTHPTALDDLLDVSVPLCRSGRGGSARDCC
jgi:hypothetical protein